MYKQEVERVRFQAQTLTVEEISRGVESSGQIIKAVTVGSFPVSLSLLNGQISLTSQPCARTEAQIQYLPRDGLECRVVKVSDRFGDYGLVGVVIFGGLRDVLDVDTFLLSCRVLGRGVEHRMLNELGKIARERKLKKVAVTLVTTNRNQPAAEFLESVAAPFRQEIVGGVRYSIPAAHAEGVVFSQALVKPEVTHVLSGATRTSRAPFERIATELFSAEQVFETLQARSRHRRSRSELDRPFVAPRTEIEELLAKLWASLLRFESVGVQDDFFELGGTSLLAVDLFAQIDRQLGQRLPLTALIEAPTIESLVSSQRVSFETHWC